MTEDEAKTKWCPMVRAGTKGSNEFVAGNWRGNEITDIDTREYTRCVGSACMMWRTAEPHYKNFIVGDGNQELLDKRIVAGESYCGLAGKP